MEHECVSMPEFEAWEAKHQSAHDLILAQLLTWHEKWRLLEYEVTNGLGDRIAAALQKDRAAEREIDREERKLDMEQQKIDNAKIGAEKDRRVSLWAKVIVGVTGSGFTGLLIYLFTKGG